MDPCKNHLAPQRNYPMQLILIKLEASNPSFFLNHLEEKIPRLCNVFLPFIAIKMHERSN